jgi:NAD(P)H dehydrogenase (quinone)
LLDLLTKGTRTVTKFLGATIGVTGAGGNLGRAVVQNLKAAGAKRIVGITRDPAKLADLAGVEARAGSFDDPATLPAAFAGVERLLVISTNDVHRRTGPQVGAVDAAVKAGVRFIAYTSVAGPYPDAHPDAAVPDSHFWTEVRIAASGVDFAMLRNNLYAHLLLTTAHHAAATGELHHAIGKGRRAHITRDDCAAAAAAALVGAEGKRVYEVGGPTALSAEELAALIAEVSGKPVKAVAVSAEQRTAELAAAGVPKPFAGVLVRFETDAAKGLLGLTAGGFEELTGRKPTALADFLKAHKAAIVG